MRAFTTCLRPRDCPVVWAGGRNPHGPALQHIHYTVGTGSQPSGIFNHVSEALTNCGTPTLYQQEQYNCDIRHHLQKY